MNQTFQILGLAFLSVVTACSKKESSGYVVEAIPTERITAELEAHSVEREEIDFIVGEISENYPLITVIKKKENGEVRLTIDEFILEEWTNPSAGTQGKTPHGTLTTYKKQNEVWEADSSLHYE